MELWMESLEAFCASSHMLSEQWKHFHTHSPYAAADATSQSPFGDVSVEMDRILTNLHQVVQPAIKETFTNRCLQPVLAILSLVPPIQDRLQQRKALLLDYDAHKAKIQKKMAAAGGSVEPSARRTEKFDETTLRLRTVQAELQANLAEFELARPVTLGPELAAFTGCIHSFASSLSTSSSQLLPCIPQAASSLARISHVVAELGLNPPRNRYSTKLLKVPDGFSTPRTSLKVLDPVVSRAEAAGGSYGGYSPTGSTTMTSAQISVDSEDTSTRTEEDASKLAETSVPFSSSQAHVSFAPDPETITFLADAAVTEPVAGAEADVELVAALVITDHPSTEPQIHEVVVAAEATIPLLPGQGGRINDGCDNHVSMMNGSPSRPYSEPNRPMLPVFSTSAPRNSAPPPKPPRVKKPSEPLSPEPTFSP